MLIFKKFLIFFAFVSIFTYAIPGIRISGIPVPVVICVFIFILHMFGFFRYPNLEYIYIPLSSAKIIAIFACYILWSLVINLINAADSDYLATQLIYPGISLSLVIILSAETLDYAIDGLYLSSIILFLYGTYGFITWNTGDPSQHILGYFGITYLESTRNGDLVYLFPGFFISYVKYQNSFGKFKKAIHLIIFFLLFIAILANQSRGGVIVIVVLALIEVKKLLSISEPGKKLNRIKKIFFSTILTFFILFLISKNIDDQYSKIIMARINSIFSLNSDSDVSYNSNSERLSILSQSFDVIKSNFFGVGITGFRDITHGELFHSENAYVSILVYYGIIGFILFSCLFLCIASITVRRTIFFYNKNLRISFFMFLAIAIYSLFNMMIDMLPVWMILGFCSVYVKKDRSIYDS